VIFFVIPGRAEGASPESITTKVAVWNDGAILKALRSWIPGSPLRGAPE